ncbi:hypothetical protein RIF29_29173 [Crotalaria pallida]|uniref:Uncharacterized protein n=1 Tax=Crotalaria pallida TaxID=3830 RepID=A0AAN9EF06_CROPI
MEFKCFVCFGCEWRVQETSKASSFSLIHETPFVPIFIHPTHNHPTSCASTTLVLANSFVQRCILSLSKEGNSASSTRCEIPKPKNS